MEQPNHILVVDDDDMTRLLMKTILSRMSYQVSEAVDGIDAWEKVPVLCPDLIILDVSMPRMDGLELTYKLKNEPNTKNIPIMIVSNHDEITDQVKAVEAGADDFLPKPVEQIILKAKVTSLLKIKSYNDYMQSYQIKLEDEVAKKTAKLKYAFDELETANKRLKLYSLDTILRLSQAAEYKDQETGQHIQRIGYYIEIIGQKISLSHQEIEEFLYASPMHDVGKIHISDSILKKPGLLSAEEWTVMQTHTIIGEKILSNRDFYRTAREIARSHHEHWDGSGYPDRLMANEIPLPARIVTVADIFDALSHKRVYKKALSMEEIRSTMKNESGKIFDPKILDVFFDLKIQFPEEKPDGAQI